MDSIYSKICEIEKNTKVAALVTIVKTSGSTPRKAGAKMIVYGDNSIFGTIGGGALENKVIKKTQEVLKINKPELVEFQLEKDLNMGCGGFVQVYIEPIIGKTNLYIFGAGHIGQNLAELANKLGFAITLIDSRKEVIDKLNKDKFTLINEDFIVAARNLLYNKNTFITIMTHSHDFDRDLVAICGKKEAAYLGMIGSKNKIAKFRNHYTENNILTEEEMKKIDWPMGIPIECQLPEEITISILAKLIDTRGKLKK